MISATGPITLIASPHDVTIVPDPKVRYRPATIGGRRYRPTPVAPRPRHAT
ncbi:hypothetical protein [Nocardia sp. alder85J]|uniref:hypothetical protein n=1 Tax=Nocardia sp. alder85J TaxID=2862949 RepID=UPI001CD6BB88|nr:hypothetical protein [Nocardia sp. alder85J]MCX4091919.1 hypothetical protein [Nocardia sp. alder85J]